MRNRRDYYCSKRIKKRKRKLFFKRVRFALMLLTVVFLALFFHSLVSTAKNLPQIKSSSQQLKQSLNTDSSLQKFQSAFQKTITNPQQNQESENLANLKTEIANYITNYKGEYGVYYYDISSGQEFGINDTDQFTSASCEKILINLYLYNQIQSGAVNPDGTLTYLQEDYETGTGSIQYQNLGTQYTIRELSRLTIVQSDNVAANMLIRFLGMQNIKNYMQQIGGQVVLDDQNVSCPRDMGLYMKLVYEFCENNSTLGNEFMNNFLNTDFNDRLPALLPSSVKVAHKIGNEVNVVNDVGIVFAPKPYIVAVMSKDVNEEEAPAVIAKISKMIYDSTQN